MKNNKFCIFNNKAFTMVELLATITILGILSLVAIPSVRYLIEKGQKNYYVTQKNQIELASKEYLKDHPERLPGEIGGTSTITLEELINHKYISKVKDKNKEDCDEQKTIINVVRTSKRKFTYNVVLICPGYKEEKEGNTNTGKIEFNVEVLKANNGNASTNNFKVKLTITGTKSKIKYYKYRVLSDSTVLEEKEYEVLGNPIEKTIDLTDYVKTKDETIVKIEITAVTTDNAKDTKTFKVSVKDTEKPLCPLEYQGTFAEVKSGNLYLKDRDGNILVKTRSGWSKDPQTVTIYCYDKNNANEITKCKNSHYTITLKNDKELNKTVTMVDRMSNKSNECAVPDNMIRIDNTAPTLDLRMKKLEFNDSAPTNISEAENNYDQKWFSGKVFVKMYAEDKPNKSGKPTSGVKHYYLTTTGADIPNEKDSDKQSKLITAEGITKLKYKVCDEAGNCTSSNEYTIKLDRTAPSCDTVYTEPSGYYGQWTNKNVTIKGQCDDTNGSLDVSGCVSNATSSYSTEMNQSVSPGSVRDNAGNTTICTSKDVKIDKTAPTVPVVKMYKKNSGTDIDSSSGLASYTNATWYSGYVYTEARGSSTDEGAGGITYYVVTTGATANVEDREIDQWNVNAEGTSTVKFKACDSVGNCSAYSDPGSSTVKLDRTAPVVSTFTLTPIKYGTIKSPKFTAYGKGSDTISGVSWVAFGGVCSGATQEGSGDSDHQVTCKVSGWNKSGSAEFWVQDFAGNQTHKTQNYSSDNVATSKCIYYGNRSSTYANFSNCGASYWIDGNGTRHTDGTSSGGGYPMYYFTTNGDIYNCRGRYGDVVFWKNQPFWGTTNIGDPGKRVSNTIHTCKTSGSCFPSDSC